MKILLSFLMIVNSSLSYAESVTYLPKGTPAPYEGLLFSKEKADEMRKELLDLDNQKEINKSYKKTIELYKQKEEITESQLQKALDVNNKMSQYIQHNDNKYEKILWFTLGVITTGLAINGAKQIIK